MAGQITRNQIMLLAKVQSYPFYIQAIGRLAWQFAEFDIFLVLMLAAVMYIEVNIVCFVTSSGRAAARVYFDETTVVATSSKAELCRPGDPPTVIFSQCKANSYVPVARCGV